MALMLTTGLIAIDATILATAVPSVVKDLGEFDQFPWLFSVYLLAQAVSVPIYSKLADTIGRKPVILVGIGLFLVGSVFAGFAWNMTSLIVFRVIQGLGAGAAAPMSMTIVGDIYTVEERALVQGYIASVWAVSSVVGPALGGVFSQFASWRWIFIVNIPLCLIAGWAIMRSYHEQVEKRRHKIDYARRRAAHRRADGRDPRPARGRQRLGMALRPERAELRRRYRKPRLVRLRRTQGCRADRRPRDPRPAAHPHHDAGLPRRRCPDDRGDELRSHLPGERPQRSPAGLRHRRRGPHPRLAAGRRQLRPRLHALGLPDDHPRRQRDRPARHHRARGDRAVSATPSRSRPLRSSSASASGGRQPRR